MSAADLRQKSAAAAIQFEHVFAPRGIRIGHIGDVYHLGRTPPSFPLFVGRPGAPTHFLGREELVSSLVACLCAEAHPVVALEGLPGAGKTTFAAMLAHHPDILEALNDGVLWARLGPQADVLRELGLWVEALGLDPSDPALAEEPARAQAIRNAIGQRRLLLVLDDVWSLEVAQMMRCGGPHCAYLLTTRDKGIAHAFGSGRTQHLPELLETEAYQLLQTLAPAACRADPEAARALVRAVGGLPLAVELLAGYLAGSGGSLFDLFADVNQEAMAELTDPKRRLHLTRHRLGEGGEAVTLLDTIALSLEDLPDAALQAFYALGAFAPKPERFSREAAEAVSAADGRTLNRLAVRNLLEVDRNQLALHQTIADIARLRTPPQALARHREYYLSVVNADPDDWKRIEVVYGQLRRAWQQAPDDETLLTFVEILTSFQFRRGHWNEVLEWAQRTLHVAETRNLQPAIGRLQAMMGKAYEEINSLDKALECQQHALRTWEALGFSPGQIEALQRMASLFYKKGWASQREQQREQQALDLLQRAHALAEASGDRVAQAESLCFLGFARRQMSRPDQAIDPLQQSLAICRELGRRGGEAEALHVLGLVYRQLSQPGLALEALQQALVSYEEQGYRIRQAQVRSEMASLFARQGRLEEALTAAQETLELWEDVGDRSGLIDNLHLLAQVHHKMQHSQAEQACLQRILTIQQELLTIQWETGNRGEQASVLVDIGNLQVTQGHLEQALATFRQALDLLEELGDQASRASVLVGVRNVYEELGEPEQAKRCLQESLAIWRTLQHRAGQASALWFLGATHWRLAEYAQALDVLRQALALYEGLGDLPKQAETLWLLGSVYVQLERYQEAFETYQQALTIWEARGNTDGQATILFDLGSLHLAQEHHEEALNAFQEALVRYRSADDRMGQVRTLYWLGIAYLRMKALEQARDAYQQALTLPEADYSPVCADILYSLGVVCRKLRQPDQALDALERARTVSEAIGDREQQARTLYLIGCIHLEQDEPERAYAALQQAMPFYPNHSQGRARCLDRLGRAQLDLGQPASARESLQEALAFWESANVASGRTTTLINLGVAFYDLEQSEPALHYLKQALTITEAAGDTVGEWMARHNLALLYAKTSELAAAAEQLRRLIELDELLQHPDREDHTAMLHQIEQDLACREPIGPD